MRVLIAAVLVLLQCVAAHAANIYLAPPIEESWYFPYPAHYQLADLYEPDDPDDIGPTPFSITDHIRIEGRIETGDAARLEELLQPGDVFHGYGVSLDSEGGSYEEALKIADLIHGWRVGTVILPGDACLSACALVFMAGNSEVIRNVMQVPSRTLTAGATVGFHAPFSALSFGDMPVDPRTMDQVAEMFYATARESIRLLQRRINAWHMSPDFVFELLGRGPEDFLFIDRAETLYANPVQLAATSAPAFPEAFTAVEAFQACQFLLYHQLALGSPDSHDRAMMQFEQFGLHEFRPDMSLIETAESYLSGEIRVPHFFPGRGTLACDFRPDPSGHWRMSASGDLPINEKADGSLILNDYLLNGLFLPWREETRLDEMADMEAAADSRSVPDDLKSIEGPGFSCGGDLSAVERLICTEPRLAKLDGVMGELYKRHADRDGVREAQRRWLAARNAGCQVSTLAEAGSARLRAVTHCLVLMTASRVARLAM